VAVRERSAALRHEKEAVLSYEQARALCRCQRCGETGARVTGYRSPEPKADREPWFVAVLCGECTGDARERGLRVMVAA
jgi:hypothetical protein